MILKHSSKSRKKQRNTAMEKGNKNSLIMDGQCFSRYHLIAMFESVCYNLYDDGFQTLSYPVLFL